MGAAFSALPRLSTSDLQKVESKDLLWQFLIHEDLISPDLDGWHTVVYRHLPSISKSLLESNKIRSGEASSCTS
jgi:hypothetical protein